MEICYYPLEACARSFINCVEIGNQFSPNLVPTIRNLMMMMMMDEVHELIYNDFHVPS
jgi:hypothetical protein